MLAPVAQVVVSCTLGLAVLTIAELNLCLGSILWRRLRVVFVNRSALWLTTTVSEDRPTTPATDPARADSYRPPVMAEPGGQPRLQATVGEKRSERKPKGFRPARV